MKKLMICLVAVASITFAGDLSTSCYLNSDPGNVVGSSNVFMQKNSISFEFMNVDTKFIVFVNRESLFKNYTYEVIKVNQNDQSYSKVIYQVSNYDQEIALGDNLYCSTMD